MSLPPEITATQLLEAMEGVAWLTDRDGVILAVAGTGWSLFAEENAAPWLTAEALTGRSLFRFMNGETVRQAYRRIHAAVAERRRPRTVFEFRCDSPIAERHMRMAISPVRSDGQLTALLYQSQIVQVVPRVPVPLFYADRLKGLAPTEAPVVQLCAFCQRVAWRAGEGARMRWIDAAEYYRRGGPSDVAVEQVVCGSCSRQVVAANA